MNLCARKDNKRRERFKIFTCYLANLHAAILALMYHDCTELIVLVGGVDVEVDILALDPVLQTSIYKAVVRGSVICSL